MEAEGEPDYGAEAEDCAWSTPEPTAAFAAPPLDALGEDAVTATITWMSTCNTPRALLRGDKGASMHQPLTETE